jgi:hypothetical protein
MTASVWLIDGLGWLATAVFVASYFCKTQTMLRRVQAVGAGLWLGYGVLLHAVPVVAANLIVATVALYSSWRPATRQLPIPSAARDLLRGSVSSSGPK